MMIERIFKSFLITRLLRGKIKPFSAFNIPLFASFFCVISIWTLLMIFFSYMHDWLIKKLEKSLTLNLQLFIQLFIIATVTSRQTFCNLERFLKQIQGRAVRFRWSRGHKCEYVWLTSSFKIIILWFFA